MDNKPRKLWIAVVLSILKPGLGQIYNGQLLKGVIFLVLPVLALPALAFSIHSGYFPQFLAIVAVLTLLYFIYALVDAVVAAERLSREYFIKKFNKTPVYIAIYIITLVLSLSLTGYIKNQYIKAYKLPSASMEPTILKGDCLLADRSLSARMPARGDLIVFQYPENPEIDFIKRVVALEGDIVQIKDKQFYLNNNPAEEGYIVHNDPYIVTEGKGIVRDNFGPATVPKDSYFVLGDNRDLSFDSRFWGFVNKTQVQGQARLIYFSWDSTDRSVRWNRIGKKLYE